MAINNKISFYMLCRRGVCLVKINKVTFYLPRLCTPASISLPVYGCSDQGLTNFTGARSNRTKRQRQTKDLLIFASLAPLSPPKAR